MSPRQDSTDHQLCHLCFSWIMQLGQPYVGNEFLHQPSFDALTDAATSCTLCALILRQFESSDQIQGIRSAISDGYPTVIQFVGLNHKQVLSDQEGASWKDLIGLLVYCGEEGRNDDWVCELRLYANESSFAAKTGLIAGRPVHSGAACETASSRITQWIEDCLQHESASPNGSSIMTRHLPTRVIALEQDVSTGLAGKLINTTRNNTVGTVYATLSHCWGKSQQITTTSTNLVERERRIGLSQLSKTMRDAVAIARHLGIQYLWIDSLCIIQDDPDDWERESALMAAVYEGAFLNLAATASPDGERGMLFQRASADCIQLSVPSGSSEIGDMTFYVTPIRTHYIDPLRQMPLNRRGWVLQERSLSPRIVHFAEDQLYWECEHHFISENNHYNTLQGQSLPGRPTMFAGRYRVGLEVYFKYWERMVVEYSRKELTKASDIFAALAGIVQRLSMLTNKKFLAGLWEDRLHENLLWIAVHAPMTRRADCNAPSWSWASRVGEISYDGHQNPHMIKPSLQIDECLTEWVGLECTSRICNCELIVRGELELVKYDPDPTNYHLHDIETFWIRLADAEQPYGYSWAVFDGEPPSLSNPIYGLPVSTIQKGNMKEMWILLLEQAHEIPNTYQRIGTGRLDKIDYSRESDTLQKLSII